MGVTEERKGSFRSIHRLYLRTRCGGGGGGWGDPPRLEGVRADFRLRSIWPWTDFYVDPSPLPHPASPPPGSPYARIRGPGSLFQRKCFYGEGFKGHPKIHFGASNSTRYSSYGRVKFQFFNGKYMGGPTKKKTRFSAIFGIFPILIYF